MKKITLILFLFSLTLYLNAQVLSQLYIYSNDIRNIAFEENTAWLATTGGWYQVDFQGNTLNHYYTNTKLKLPEYYTYKIVVGPDKKKYSTDFGTGLTQFDGTKFIKLTPPTNYNITYYGNLFSDDKGVHTTTNAGLLSYDGTNWSLLSEYTDKNNVSQKLNATLQAYSKDSKGNIWLLNDKGVLKYDGKSWVIFELANLPNKPSSIFELVLKNNTVYVSSNVGLLVYENNVWKVFDNKNGLYSYSISGINTINSVSDDSNGNTWVITSGNPNLIINGVVSNQLIPKDLFGKNITKVVNCPSGEIWFGTEKKGVLSLDKNYSTVKTVFEDKNPTLGSDAMKSAFQDTKGNKYFLNSNYTGVTRFDGQKWETTPLQFLLNDGTKTPIVNPNSIAEDSKGRIWISTTNALFMFDGSIWYKYGLSEGLPIINVRGLCVDKQDNIWVGGNISAGTIYKYDGTKWDLVLDKNKGYASNADARYIFSDSENNIWIGTNVGLYKYDGKTLVQFTIQNGLVGNLINGISQDSKGQIWVSTSTGMSIYNGSKFENYPTSPTLFVQACYKPIFDKNNNAWIASAGGGLCKYDGKNITQVFSDKNGLTSNYVRDVLIDNNDLWVIADGGVSVFKNAIVSNDEIENVTQISKIFPNPTKENLSIFSNVEENTKYQITNINGQILQEGIILNNSINVKSIEQGIYILSFKAINGELQSIKFVKVNDY